MVGTAFRDPGIIPRNLDLAPPLTTTASTNSLVPIPRDIRVRAGRVTVKYCETCRIYRPPRSSHCRVCGNCVDGIDHHCTYLHACVGRRNYTSFISFLVFTFLALVYTVVFSAIHLWRLTRNGRAENFKEALGQNAGSGVSFVLGVMLVLPVGLLMSYHLRLMMNNSTTIEEIRRSAAQNVTPRPPSPFAILLFWRARLPTPPPTSNDPSSNDNPSNPFRFKHWYTNFGRMLCRPAVPSWMEFDKEVERRGDGREEEGMGMRERRQTGGEEKWRN
ncbi:DHHC palmitoyltransferase-domain-containing protein [Mrakia frigida]|uniref:DHHC family palmitoyltransferase n=1 Tax=Mrakia frigida TaxID=29902 RepID=UPI003FCC2041